MLDLVEGGSSWEEIVQLATAIEAAGATIINTGIGWHEARVPTIATCVPRAAFTPVTQKMMLENAVSIPLVSTNRINTPEVAEQVLHDGHSDLVSMARPFLADPDIVLKAAQGREEEVNPCIACNQACLDHSFVGKRASCLVNPISGYESTLGEKIKEGIVPDASRQRVAVVGSGPAGLAFASTAALRGHHVTMYESSDRIGGQFNMAKRIPGKEEFSGTLKYFDSVLRAREAEGTFELKLNTTADAATLAAGGYDAVVVCTGVTPRIPSIEGGDHPSVLTYWDVLAGGKESQVGEKVAIVGAGGIGFDVAEFVHHLRPGSPLPAGSAPNAFVRERQRRSESPSLNVESFGKMEHRSGCEGGLAADDAPGWRMALRLEKFTCCNGKRPGKGLGRTTGWIHRASVKHMASKRSPASRTIELTTTVFTLPQRAKSNTRRRHCGCARGRVAANDSDDLGKLRPICQCLR